VQKALQDTVDDLIAGQPDLVVIDQTKDQIYIPGGTFDWLGFWSQDPRFASFWQNYVALAPVAGRAVYAHK